MKSLKRMVGGLLVCTGFVALLSLLHAQAAETSVVQVEPLSLKATDMQSLKKLSDAELETFVNLLDAMPTISFDALPLNGRAGTCYSLQHPE